MAAVQVYDELPPRVRQLLPLTEWKSKWVQIYLWLCVANKAVVPQATTGSKCSRTCHLMCPAPCRVKEHCIQRGFSWNDSLASTSCAEAEYYEDLLRFYRYHYRVSPCIEAEGCQAIASASVGGTSCLPLASKDMLREAPASRGCTQQSVLLVACIAGGLCVRRTAHCRA